MLANIKKEYPENDKDLLKDKKTDDNNDKNRKLLSLSLIYF